MEAVILIGIQGAGKTTLYRERLFDTHVRVSLDLMKTRSRELAFLRTCLGTGQRFAVDNTNVRASERAVYIAAAKAAGFRIIGYYFDVELRDALRRNAQRTGKGKIPAVAVIGTLKRFERPKMEEGFHELHLVRCDAADRFIIDTATDLEGAVNG